MQASSSGTPLHAGVVVVAVVSVTVVLVAVVVVPVAVVVDVVDVLVTDVVVVEIVTEVVVEVVCTQAPHVTGHVSSIDLRVPQRCVRAIHARLSGNPLHIGLVVIVVAVVLVDVGAVRNAVDEALEVAVVDSVLLAVDATVLDAEDVSVEVNDVV